ncbi:diguanylate cyclase [Pseudomonas sp. UBA6562]|uniref:diguanylate cyclase n=1 Tax=Pseudomonas sp. UBA6562 TaxID=1947332 RepID=UPI0025DB088F|nr:diguanylate cyclase [Pseudomonas sp. UBA6562]
MHQPTGKGLSFARRMYLPRAIGTGLGFFCVAIGIWPLQPGAWVWLVLLAHGFVWPHVAFQLARGSANPFRTEQRNLLFDGFAGGAWVGVMGLNPLPSVIVLSMIAMDKIAAGGWHMLVKTFAAQAMGIVVGFWLYGPPLLPPTTQQQMLACLPILLIYPIAVGMVCYQVMTQLNQHKRALARLSQTDSLTGLTNHGALKDLLLREFERCRAQAAPTHLALIDVDHFKHINDTYGHLVGDSILRTISATLAAQLRKRDPMARYGGDEFCVLLPETSTLQAQEILERLRQAVEDFRHPELGQLRVTLSIGVAAHGPALVDADAWLHAADMALYQAKHGGRNRVVLAGFVLAGEASAAPV